MVVVVAMAKEEVRCGSVREWSRWDLDHPTGTRIMFKVVGSAKK